MSDIDLDELADELSEFAPPEQRVGRSPREEPLVLFPLACCAARAV